MAKGVVCPHCKSELEGDIELNEIIECPECHRQFDVTKQTILAYKQINPTVFQQLRTWITPLLGLILVVLFVFTTCSEKSRTVSAPTTNSNGTRAGTSEDAKYFSSWNGANDELVAYVKHGMKDPSTFEHIDTRFKDNGSSYSIKMTFKGKNSFNAVVTQTVTADLDKATRKLSNIQEIK